MDTKQQTGIRNLKLRLAVSIRDAVLMAVVSPNDLATLTGIPRQELGTIADLRDDQRVALAGLMARVVDDGIHKFLYGLDNQPDGLEVRYQGQLLNDETCCLPDDNVPIWQFSQFGRDGLPKQKT